MFERLKQVLIRLHEDERGVVTAGWFYNAFLQAFGRASTLMNLEAASRWKVLLTDNTYALDNAAHDNRNDVTNEVSSAGYTAGGYTLTGVTMALASTVWNWTAGNPSWTGVSFTARKAVYWDSVGGGTDATRPLVSWVNFGADQVISSANFSLTHDAAGIVKVTIS